MRRRLSLVLTSLLMLALVAPAGLPALAQNSDPAVEQAVAYLQGQVQPSGGFLGFSGEPDPSTSADVAIALGAAGVDPASVTGAEGSLLDFLTASAPEYGATTGGAAKLSIAALASGIDPTNFGGVDLVQQIQDAHDPDSGLFDEQIYVHALAMIALAGADIEVSSEAVDALVERQIEDGSWAFSGSTEPGEGDSNTTSMAIQALLASGGDQSDAVESGLEYLASAQTEDGSFLYAVDGEGGQAGDANSTALAIQALVAAGEDPASDEWGNAVEALRGFQNESGAFRYQEEFPDDNLLATAQAVPALLLMPFPIQGTTEQTDADASDSLSSALEPVTPGDNNVCIFVDQTEHNVCWGFRAFWEDNGGADMFGLPISEEFTDPESGRTVQYFENVRFEWHPGEYPERYDVLLGSLGVEAVGTR